MGEGQESIAVEALQKAARGKQWIILKNLHLVTHWLPSLCQTIQTLELNDESR